MAGCLGIVIVILAIAFVFNFPIVTIGFVILTWGIYEWSVNRKLKAKSKIPA